MSPDRQPQPPRQPETSSRLIARTSLPEVTSAPSFFVRNLTLLKPKSNHDALRSMLLLEQADHFGWLLDTEFRRRLLSLAPIAFGPELLGGAGGEESEEISSGAVQHRFSRSTTLLLDDSEIPQLKCTLVARWHSRVDDTASPVDPSWVVERGFASRMARHREVLLDAERLRTTTLGHWPTSISEEQAKAYGVDAWGQSIPVDPGSPIRLFRLDSFGHCWLAHAAKQRLTAVIDDAAGKPREGLVRAAPWELTLANTLLPLCHFPCLPSSETLGVVERERLAAREKSRPTCGIHRMSLEDTLIYADLRSVSCDERSPRPPPPFEALGPAVTLAFWKAHYRPSDLSAQLTHAIQRYAQAASTNRPHPLHSYFVQLIRNGSLLSATRRYALQALATIAPESAVQLARCMAGDRSRIMQVAGAEFLAAYAPEHLPEYRRSIRTPTYSQQAILRRLAEAERPSP